MLAKTLSVSRPNTTILWWISLRIVATEASSPLKLPSRCRTFSLTLTLSILDDRLRYFKIRLASIRSRDIAESDQGLGV